MMLLLSIPFRKVIMKHIELLVIGATGVGLGLIASRGNADAHVLLIDRGIIPGAEFINALVPGDGWETPPSSPTAKSVYDELIARNVLSNGRIHLPAVSPVLYGRMKPLASRIRLSTELLGVAKAAAGYEVTISDAGGISKITAAAIIDTTAERISKPRMTFASKAFNALLDAPAKDYREIIGQHGNAAVLPGRFDSERFLSLPMAAGDGFPEARKKLSQFWHERDDALKPWAIAATAGTFAYTVNEKRTEIAPSWLHLPSAAYPNITRALEAGESVRV